MSGKLDRWKSVEAYEWSPNFLLKLPSWLFTVRVTGWTRAKVELWLVPFRGHHGSIDCVALVNDEYFVSGGDDSAINFWSAKRKKPIVVIRNAHGGKWITGKLWPHLCPRILLLSAANGYLVGQGDRRQNAQAYGWPVEYIKLKIVIIFHNYCIIYFRAVF